MDKVTVLGVEIDNLSLREAVSGIMALIKRGEPALVVTANPEIILLAGKDRGLRECLESAGMVTADGIGVVIGTKLLGKPVKERVTGIDLITALFAASVDGQLKFYFVGAEPGVAEKAADNVRNKYPGAEIVGAHDGYFQDDTDVIAEIGRVKPDIVLAGLGMGKQEKWLKSRVLPTGVPVCIGVGGSFDVLSGRARRAPIWVQRAGLEWLFRLLKEPWRYRRMLQLPKFLLAVLRDKKTTKK